MTEKKISLGLPASINYFLCDNIKNILFMSYYNIYIKTANIWNVWELEIRFPYSIGLSSIQLRGCFTTKIKLPP